MAVTELCSTKTAKSHSSFFIEIISLKHCDSSSAGSLFQAVSGRGFTPPYNSYSTTPLTSCTGSLLGPFLRNDLALAPLDFVNSASAPDFPAANRLRRESSAYKMHEPLKTESLALTSDARKGINIFRVRIPRPIV